MIDDDVIQTARVRQVVFWSAAEGGTLYAIPTKLEGWKVEECGRYRKIRLCPGPGQEGHEPIEITVMRGAERIKKKVDYVDVLDSEKAVRDGMQKTDTPLVWWAAPWRNSDLPGLWQTRKVVTDEGEMWDVHVWTDDAANKEVELERKVLKVLKGLNFNAVTHGCEEKVPDFAAKIIIEKVN